MKALLQRYLDLIFPRSCLHCGDFVDASNYSFICKSCADSLIECLPPACTTCGYPYYGEIVSAKACPHCIELDPVFDQGKTLFVAKGVGRSILHDLKYRQGAYVLKDLDRMVTGSKHYLKFIAGTILVPVPLHPVKLRERGLNQSEQIAKMLAACAGHTTKVEKLLVRTRYTESQTRLNRSRRYQNVKNAFALARNTILDSKEIYTIIDDVFTTGSTLNECARVLRNAGAIHLQVATIGHG